MAVNKKNKLQPAEITELYARNKLLEEELFLIVILRTVSM